MSTGTASRASIAAIGTPNEGPDTLPSVDFPTEPLPSLGDVLRSPETVASVYHRRLTLAIIVAFALVIFPVWMHTTQVYRATLPFARIDRLASHRDGATLLSSLHSPIYAVIALYPPSHNTNVDSFATATTLAHNVSEILAKQPHENRFSRFTSSRRFDFLLKPLDTTPIADTLRSLVIQWNTYAPRTFWSTLTRNFANAFIQNGLLSVNALESNGYYEIHVSCDASAASTNNSNDDDDDDNGLDHALVSQKRAVFFKTTHKCDSPQLSLAIADMLLLLFGDEMYRLDRTIAADQHRREIALQTDNTTSTANQATEKISNTAVQQHSETGFNDLNDDDDDSVATISYNNEYQLTVSLLNGDTSKLLLDWDIEDALQSYIQPFISALGHLHNISVKSQILNYATLPIEPLSIEVTFPSIKRKITETKTISTTTTVETTYTESYLHNSDGKMVDEKTNKEFFEKVNSYMAENSNSQESEESLREQAQQQYLESGQFISDEILTKNEEQPFESEIVENSEIPLKLEQFLIPYNLLGNFINSAEWALASAVFTAPPLNFLLYVPEESQSPLYVATEAGDIFSENSFLVPQWGGVVISNVPFIGKTPLLKLEDYPDLEESIINGRNGKLPPEIIAKDGSKVKYDEIDRFKFNKKLLKPVMEKFLMQLRRTMGIKPLSPPEELSAIESEAVDPRTGETYIVNAIDFEIEPSPKRGVTDWELDVLERRRIIQNLLESLHSLRSLASLVRSLENIVILDAVSQDVFHAVDAVEATLVEFQQGRYNDARQSSITAFVYSDSAYFDPTMVGMLYFPEEHKYAVYMPLFIPVSVPLLASIFKEVKAYLQERRKKKKKKTNSKKKTN